MRMGNEQSFLKKKIDMKKIVNYSLKNDTVNFNLKPLSGPYHEITTRLDA